MSKLDPELSDGSIVKLLDGQYLEGDLILQILDFCCLNDNMVNRLRLSDGMFSTRFAVMCGELMDNLKMAENCVIQLITYELKNITKDKENRYLIVIYNAKVLSHHGQAIGTPENLDALHGGAVTTAIKPENIKTEVKVETDSVKMETNGTEKKAHPFPSTADFQAPRVVEPNPLPCRKVSVASLGTTVKEWRDWVIKVRVVLKLPIKTIYNGLGKMSSWDFADSTGTIRAMAFDEQCERLAPMQLNKGYWLSGAQLRLARDPTLTGHSYELKLERFTFVRECSDDSDLPGPKFSFTTLDALAGVTIGKFIDIVGVCSRASDLTRKNPKSPLVRRVMLVSPDVGLANEIELELSGKAAEDFDATTHPVVVVKNCKYIYYEVKPVLFLNSQSVLLLDPPNIPEAVFLKSWYKEKMDIGEVPRETEAAPVPEFLQDEILIQTNGFAEARKLMLTSKVQVAYVKCTVTVIDTDPQYFVNMTCTSCRGQVYDLNLEKLVCSSCGYVEGGVMKSMGTKIRVGEGTSSEWAHVSDVECRKMLGASSSFLTGHNTSLWHNLQGLVGQQFHAHLKFDKNKHAKVPCQVLELEAMPESVYF